MSKRADYTVGNRDAMPVIASVVDEIRAMGIDVKVLFASENGMQFDRREPEEHVYELDPSRFSHPVSKKGKR